MALVVKTRIPSSDDIRRFCINSDTTLSSLMSTLKMLYPTMSHITVKYQQSDSTVEIKTEAEFREAVSAAHKSRPPILRLVLEQQSPNLLDSTWIVVPEETQLQSVPEVVKPSEEKSIETKPPAKLFSFSSLPSIFGFQLPSFAGSLSSSPSNSSSKLADEIKEASEKARVESTLMDIEPELNIDLTSVPASDELVFEMQEVEPPATILIPTPTPDSSPQLVDVSSECPAPKRLRTVDICARLSEETRASCISNSNQTMSDSIPFWKNTLADCSDYSKSTLASCSQISEETTRVCGRISSDIAAMTVNIGTSPQRTQAELSVIKNCEDLSKSTAKDCRELSRSLVAELLAL